MTPAVQVRRLAAPDLPVLVATQPAWRELMPQWLDDQDRGRAVILVAWADGEPVGSAQLLLEPKPPELRNVAVLPERRNEGHGSRLIGAAENAASAYGSIRIGVGVDNPGARRLYARLGYRPTGETETTTYSYLDADGVRRTTTETSEELIKDL